MVLPLIPVAIGAAGVVGIVGAAIVARSLTTKLTDKRVAILGAQEVGKTTLLHVLRDGVVPTKASHTIDPAAGGVFTLMIKGQPVKFEVKNDVPGHEAPGLNDWKGAFTAADYVWYLFRSDLIVQGDKSEIARVKEHLDTFKMWSNEKGGKKPKIILIGTWADQDSTFQARPATYKQTVSDANPIGIGLVLLNNARLVVGSLQTTKSARALIKSLESQLG